MRPEAGSILSFICAMVWKLHIKATFAAEEQYMETDT